MSSEAGSPLRCVTKLSYRGVVNAIGHLLDFYFPDPKVPLIYRDPYTLLIAVLLSAQCQDERVNQVTPLLFEKGDTAEKIAALHIEQIEEIIRPCGLFRAKAKAIKKLSEIIVEEHGGKVPRTLEALEKLPGVGHKTASVLLVQAFGIPAFPVDTHIHRLAKRWHLSDGTSVKKTEADLKKAFRRSLWGKRHLQMVLFGRSYCKARGHREEECPICALFPNTSPKEASVSIP